MALKALNELEEKELTSDDHSDPRTSNDSDASPLDELDPLNYDGPRRKQGNTSSNGYHKEATQAEFVAWTDYWYRGQTTLRSHIERYIPIARIEHHPYARRLRRRIPSHPFRRARRKLGLTVPGRILGFIAATLAAIVILIIASGAFVYRKSTYDGQSPPWYPAPRGGTSKEWEASYSKAAALVKRMTLAEKVNVTTGTGWSMGMCVGNTGPALEAGFPALCLQDGPLGLRFADHITASPAGITVGATWNKHLMYKRGRAMGIEGRLKGVNVILGPSVGPLGRMPAGGRNFEGFGSDPVLQGIAAAETVRGIQDEGVIATIKHFVGNEQEHFRQSFEWGLPNALSSNIDDRTLHEVYAWPFADSIRAGVASAMCSYNQVNNSYACQNSYLLNGILKDELGFQGFIQSDWLAQRSGVASTLAGLDMSMPGDGYKWADGSPYWGQHLTTSILNGTVPVERLKDMVTRIVAAWYQLGQDDTTRWPKPPPVGTGGPNFSSWTDDKVGLLHPGSDDNSTGVVNQFVDAAGGGDFSHSSLARAVAAEGIVLLKNDDEVLPLTRNGWSQAREHGFVGRSDKFKIAVIGEDSRQADGGPNACEDRACNRGTLATGWGSGAVEFPYLITPLEAMRGSFHEAHVDITSFPSNKLPSTLKGPSIEDQDLCIVFVNADAGEGFRSSEGIKGDRNDIEIQHHGNALIADVAGRCGSRTAAAVVGAEMDSSLSNVIVVIHSVGPVIVEPFIDIPNVKSVVMASLPGQESGHALMDVLLGDVSPSGHLPYTMGKRLEDYGPGGQIKYYPNRVVPQQDFSEGLLIDYRWFDSQNITPRYPFGYGLSYTTFALTNLTIQPTNIFARPDKYLPLRPDDSATPPTYAHDIPDASEAIWPSSFRRLKKYVYPYITSEQAATAQDALARATSRPSERQEAHPRSPAGGSQGGHPALWEILATAKVTLQNTGRRDGQAVVQLYVRFPDDVYEGIEISSDPHSPIYQPGEHPGVKHEPISFPVRLLRGFEKVHTYAKHDVEHHEEVKGQAALEPEYTSTQVEFNLTRRDLSYWSVRRQSWVLPDGGFTVEVGFSAGDLPVEAKLW